MTAIWILALALAAAPAAADQGAMAPVLAHADAMVTVEFVLRIKIEGAPADREIEGDIDCLLVGAEDGLVLCSNTELGGYVGVLGRMIGGGRGVNVSGAPTDIEVRLGPDREPVPGQLVTRDTDRDLAWVQVALPDDYQARPLALDRHADLAVGDRFVALRRMHRFFDRAPATVGGTVGAVTVRPRRLLVPSQPLQVGFGVPVFTAGGKLVGLTVAQMPDPDEAANLFGNSLPFLSVATKVGDMVGGLILPAAEVADATRLARELIAQDEAEALGSGE